ALVKARGEFPPIEKDKVNPHFKMAYASLDSVLDAVTPVLCKHGLVIVQVLEKGQILKTQLFHESGEVLTSEYELPSIEDSQKRGAAITYARRYSICALLSIAADEDNDCNTAKNEQKNDRTKPSPSNNNTSNISNSIRQIRTFLGVDQQYVIEWLTKNNTTITNLKNVDKLIKDMCIDWAVGQGIDEFYALDTYSDIIQSPDLAGVQKWQQTLFKEK
ncbi:MAG: ERF family protein, partial [Dolichospermum sp.]